MDVRCEGGKVWMLGVKKERCGCEEGKVWMY